MTDEPEAVATEEPQPTTEAEDTPPQGRSYKNPLRIASVVTRRMVTAQPHSYDPSKEGTEAWTDEGPAVLLPQEATGWRDDASWIAEPDTVCCELLPGTRAKIITGDPDTKYRNKVLAISTRRVAEIDPYDNVDFFAAVHHARQRGAFDYDRSEASVPGTFVKIPGQPGVVFITHHQLVKRYAYEQWHRGWRRNKLDQNDPDYDKFVPGDHSFEGVQTWMYEELETQLPNNFPGWSRLIPQPTRKLIHRTGSVDKNGVYLDPPKPVKGEVQSRAYHPRVGYPPPYGLMFHQPSTKRWGKLMTDSMQWHILQRAGKHRKAAEAVRLLRESQTE